MSTIQKIQEKITELEIGKLYTIRYFLSCGNRKTVSNILAKLTKDGVISRVIRGVYTVLEKSSYIGEVIPEPITIALSILKKDTIIQIQEAESARLMGFSTQVPVRTIFYINDNSRYFHTGKLKVILKKVNQQRLYLAGSKAGIALSALRYLGKEELTINHIKQICLQLSPEEFDKLCHVKMTKWMTKVFTQYKKGVENE